MNRIAYALIEVGASAICVIPIFFIYERVVFHNIKKGLLSTVFAFYLVGLLYYKIADKEFYKVYNSRYKNCRGVHDIRNSLFDYVFCTAIYFFLDMGITTMIFNEAERRFV